MGTIDKLKDYESPQVEMIEVQIEKGFAGSNLENPELGDVTDW